MPFFLQNPSRGMEYKGSLKSIDQYMNLQILNTEDRTMPDLSGSHGIPSGWKKDQPIPDFHAHPNIAIAS